MIATQVSIQPSGTYPLSPASSLSPRSTPDPAELNISRRLDSRYQAEPVRHSLTAAHHMKTAAGEAGYSLSQVRLHCSRPSLYFSVRSPSREISRVI